jgi:hypothetical protein
MGMDKSIRYEFEFLLLQNLKRGFKLTNSVNIVGMRLECDQFLNIVNICMNSTGFHYL